MVDKWSARDDAGFEGFYQQLKDTLEQEPIHATTLTSTMNILYQSWQRYLNLLPLVMMLFLELPTASAQFINGQAADLALGQPDLFTNTQRVPPTEKPIASSLLAPGGMAVDPTTGKLFVADQGNHRVLRFTSTTALQTGMAAEGVLGQPDFTTANAPNPPTARSMHQPVRLAFDAAGTLYVADMGNSRVLRFDSASEKPNGAAADGVLGQPDFRTNTIPVPPTVRSMFKPSGVAVDADGRLYVADTDGYNRVLRFDNAAQKANGAPADGVLGQPNFSTNLLVDPPTASSMWGPASVVTDAEGTLFISEFSNNRVLRFDRAAEKANGAPADGVLGQPDFMSKLLPDPPTVRSFYAPEGLALDASGRLYVSNQLDNRVLWFNRAAEKANGAAADGVLGHSNFTTRRERPVSSAALSFPRGLAVDNENGYLFVADSHSRVVRFSSQSPLPVEAPIDLDAITQLLLFPQPFEASVTLKLFVQRPEQVQVEAYDLLGRSRAILFQGFLVGGREHTLSVDTARWTKGLYIFRVTGKAINASHIGLRLGT